MAQNAPHYSWNNDPNGDAKQPGLEVRPTWMHVKQPVDEAWPLPDEDRKSRKICGFRPAVFCLVLLSVILVVGGAIGGGIGGYIATHPSTPTVTPDPKQNSNTTSEPPPGRTDPPLASCSSSYDGQFNLRIINATSTTNRDEGFTYCDAETKLPCVKTLDSGVLANSDAMINYVGCNDKLSSIEDLSVPCKKFTEFSVCSNGSLAIGGSALWYSCWTESWDSKGFFMEPKSDRCYPLYLMISAI